ncbi:MAG: hypothetical protein GTO41_25085, partial [Burkholderiales bacterium]|nr:hypothetical protein [Burkholderiales bacterium]
ERQDRDLWLIDDCSMEGACQMTWPRGRNIIQVCKPAEEFIFCKPIALLHLDADHTEPVVREHLFKYAPHVVVGGAIVFHDFGGQEYPGVKAAWEYWLNQVASRSRHWQKTAAAGSVQVVRRV